MQHVDSGNLHTISVHQPGESLDSIFQPKAIDGINLFLVIQRKCFRRNREVKISMAEEKFLHAVDVCDVFLLGTTIADVNYFMLSCRYRGFALIIQRNVLGISLQNNAKMNHIHF